MYDHVIKCFTR